MSLLDHAEIVDAKRFEQIAHAHVMTSGRLRFATDAMEMMHLENVSGIILFSFPNCNDDEVEFLAVTCTKDDPRAFSLKTSGPYKYLSLKNFLVQQGLNFKAYSITFEVTEVNERFEGDKPVYRLTMRCTPKSKVQESSNSEMQGTDDMPF